MEDLLNRGDNIEAISRALGRSWISVAREIKRHRLPEEAPDGEQGLPWEECPKLAAAPFVCNGCLSLGECRGFQKQLYDAGIADEVAGFAKVESRRGIDCTYEQLTRMVSLVRPLLLGKNMTPEQIWALHGDVLPVSYRTFYRYINLGVMEMRDGKLPEGIKLKPRERKQGPGSLAP